MSTTPLSHLCPGTSLHSFIVPASPAAFNMLVVLFSFIYSSKLSKVVSQCCCYYDGGIYEHGGKSCFLSDKVGFFPPLTQKHIYWMNMSQFVLM